MSLSKPVCTETFAVGKGPRNDDTIVEKMWHRMTKGKARNAGTTRTIQNQALYDSTCTVFYRLFLNGTLTRESFSKVDSAFRRVDSAAGVMTFGEIAELVRPAVDALLNKFAYAGRTLSELDGGNRNLRAIQVVLSRGAKQLTAAVCMCWQAGEAGEGALTFLRALVKSTPKNPRFPSDQRADDLIANMQHLANLLHRKDYVRWDGGKGKVEDGAFDRLDTLRCAVCDGLFCDGACVANLIGLCSFVYVDAVKPFFNTPTLEVSELVVSGSVVALMVDDRMLTEGVLSHRWVTVINSIDEISALYEYLNNGEWGNFFTRVNELAASYRAVQRTTGGVVTEYRTPPHFVYSGEGVSVPEASHAVTPVIATGKRKLRDSTCSDNQPQAKKQRHNGSKGKGAAEPDVDFTPTRVVVTNEQLETSAWPLLEFDPYPLNDITKDAAFASPLLGAVPVPWPSSSVYE